MLQFCSYFVCENNSWKEFITPNMSKIGEIFKFLDLVQIFGTSSKMLRFCSYLVWWILFLSRFHTPNMSKIGAFLTMSKILDPIFLTIRKKSPLNFWYVALNRQIYLKNGPKVLGNIGHWEPFLTGTPYFWCLEMATVPKRLGLGPKFFRLRNHHTGS